jgi:PAS domain S-box-containing protein
VTDDDDLRARAERRLGDGEGPDRNRLLHELEVHRVELQLQNEELRRTRDELVASEVRYWGFYEFAPVGYVALDHRGIIRTANLAAAALLGVERAHLPGTLLCLLVDPPSLAVFSAFLDRVRSSDERQMAEVRLAGGSAPWVHLEGRRAPDDRARDSLLVTMMDVSARRQIEDVLAESERRSRELVEGSPLAILVLRDGVTLYANPAATALFELAAPGDALGRAITDLVEPGSCEAAWMLIAPPTDGRDAAREARLRLSGGREVAVRYWCRAVWPGGDGAVQLVLQDITAERAAQQELRAYAHRLARSNEELQRFAYVASHDLQEPLRSIVSFSQLLERRYRGKLDAEADEFIGFIVEGGNRMQQLIQDLLKLSRVGTRARPLERTDAGTIIADALRLLEAAIREAGATVVVDDDLPPVMADPDQLAQVFSNLVGNAIKYRRPEVPLEIRISAERTDGMAEFAVTDNGIGIEPEYFDRIFEMFRRLHTHDRYEGTGIGLAIVKRIVERHGGTVRVESVPGEGSTFFFTLPTV